MVMERLPTVVDPTQPPSKWIEPLSDLIKGTTPRRRSSVMWDGVDRGVLEIGRTGIVEQQTLIPDAQMQLLLASGKLTHKPVPARLPRARTRVRGSRVWALRDLPGVGHHGGEALPARVIGQENATRLIMQLILVFPVC